MGQIPYDYNPIGIKADEEEDLRDYLSFTASENNSTIQLKKYLNPSSVSLQYSRDKKKWFTYTINEVITMPNIGDVIYFRGDNDHFSDNNGYYTFIPSIKVYAGGNVMSLVDKSCSSVTIPNAKAFQKLFSNSIETVYRGGVYSAPKLPAVNLTDGCYNEMFRECRDLVSYPELPATILKNECYVGMFRDCNAVSGVVKLPASELKSTCYSNLFKSNNKLNKIYVNFTQWGTSSDTYQWVSNVASSGTFYCPKALPLIYDNSHIPTGWKVEYIDDYLEFKATQANSAVNIRKSGSPSDINLQYSTDKENWSQYTLNTPIELTNVNDTVYFKGVNNTIGQSSSNNYRVEITGQVDSDGDLMWLLLNSDGTKKTTIPQTCFFTFFQNATGLTKAPYWSAENIAASGLLGTFTGCTGLTSTPDLKGNVKTLGNDSYRQMFNGCSALTGVTALPNNLTSAGNAIYQAMFKNCTSLRDATALALPSTVYNTCYYYMFQGCTALTGAPALPVTNLTGADGCYSNMFAGCTSLKTAPALPATTLANNCYGGMFNGCTSLTDMPELPATTLAVSCYNWMFNGCTALTGTTDLPATSGTNYCYQRMFQGCNHMVTPPTMHLTTVAQGCCDVMFWNCSALSAAPYLPATTLAQGCYGGMFNSCTSLKSISAEFTSWTDVNGTGNWVANVNSQGTFYCPSLLPEEHGNNRIPTNWNVVTPQAAVEYLYFEAEQAGTDVSVWCESETPSVNLDYSTDGNNWSTYTVGDTITLANVGDRVYFKGDNPDGFNNANDNDEWYGFVVEGLAKCGGDIMTIIDSTGQTKTIPNECCFQDLFAGQPITTAPKLTATTLKADCYATMFAECSNLSSIYVDFTNWNNGSYTSNWVENVPNIGVFSKPSALSDSLRGKNYIPVGWNVENH